VNPHLALPDSVGQVGKLDYRKIKVIQITEETNTVRAGGA
jgi:hypothetical protein